MLRESRVAYRAPILPIGVGFLQKPRHGRCRRSTLIKGDFPQECGQQVGQASCVAPWIGTEKSQMVPAGRRDGYEASASGHFGQPSAWGDSPSLSRRSWGSEGAPEEEARARAAKKCQGRSGDEGKEEGRNGKHSRGEEERNRSFNPLARWTGERRRARGRVGRRQLTPGRIANQKLTLGRSSH